MPTFSLSAGLIDEIFQILVKLPYGTVAQIIAKLQTECAASLPSGAPTAPPTPPTESGTVSQFRKLD